MFQFLLTTVSILHIIQVYASSIPSIRLFNAANKDLRIPVIGLGTYGYAPYGGKPENWTNEVGYNASLLWASIGGTRWDSANSYQSKQGVADALLQITNNYTTIPRSNIFITQKIGGNDGESLGYNNVMEQFNNLLQIFKTDYFDLLLMHWPSCEPSIKSLSSDPVCQNMNNYTYNASLCRQNTWNALMDLYNNGSARSIGVSNFEEKHLLDIFKMNKLLPSINQFEFHGYWHEFELVKLCQENNITVNSYAPLGTPDVETKQYNNWTYVMTQYPLVIQIGETYNKSAAQIWLKWAYQQGIILNPRTLNIKHMKQNIDIFDFQLTSNEMQQLSSINDTAPNYPLNKVCPDPNTFP